MPCYQMTVLDGGGGFLRSRSPVMFEERRAGFARLPRTGNL